MSILILTEYSNGRLTRERYEFRVSMSTNARSVKVFLIGYSAEEITGSDSWELVEGQPHLIEENPVKPNALKITVPENIISDALEIVKGGIHFSK